MLIFELVLEANMLQFEILLQSYPGKRGALTVDANFDRAKALSTNIGLISSAFSKKEFMRRKPFELQKRNLDFRI